jgi:acyl carrier protein
MSEQTNGFNDKVAIQEKVMSLIAETLKIDQTKVFPEAKLVEDLGADSLDQVELIMALEAAFDCEIPQEEAEKITSIAQIVDHLHKITSDKKLETKSDKN